MSSLEEVFAAGLARHTDAVADPDLAALESVVLGGARRTRRTRAMLNGALTVAASVLAASAAWLSIHTAFGPAAPSPSPSPSLAGALPTPALDPVWDGTLDQPSQPVPAAFADVFDVAELAAIEPPSRNYPEAYAMSDRIWDEVRAGWSLQTWRGDGHGDPNNLYLVSPGGTYFLVRELDLFAGEEWWDVESWSASPARAVLSGQDIDSITSTRRLIDLRTGATLREWGATDDGGTAADYTVLATGFSDGRSVQLEFAMDRGYREDDGVIRPDGDITIRIVAPDGTSRTARTGEWSGLVPSVSGLGGDAHTALIQDGNASVLVVDLDAATVRPVTLEYPEGKTCQSIALGPEQTIVAYCYEVDSLAIEVTSFDARDGSLIESRELNGSVFSMQGFDSDGGGLVDRANGAVIDVARFNSWDTNVELVPAGENLFLITDTMPQHKGLMLYDRSSGQSFTVVGATVRDSRAIAAVNSVVALTDVVPDVSGLVMGASP